MITEPNKDAFLKTWPGGYCENWEVYGPMSGVSEADFTARCLSTFYNQDHVVLEIGCGGGFWLKKLAPNFKRVIGLDLLPECPFKADNVQYVEVPDRDYSCFGVEDASVDFVWSFGVFCHLTLDSIQKYLDSAFRKLRPGGRAALYFSNNERRPGKETIQNDADSIIWVGNNWKTSKLMMERAGFSGIYDLLPSLPDTMAFGEKL